MRIAIIGGGISGLGAAWLLSFKHEVVLFEKESRLGGHSHTIDVTVKNKVFRIDTGFMVMSPRHYPQLTRFFKVREVSLTPAEMSVGFSLENKTMEYAIPTGVFADRKNLFRPSFLKMLLEIPRFNKKARLALTRGISPEETIDSFLNAERISQTFRNLYLYPFASLFWSAPPSTIATFSLELFLRFFDNHNLLSLKPNGEWYSITGGSREYVNKMESDIRNRGAIIHLETPVASVVRKEGRVVISNKSATEIFDAVVFGTHADTTLTLLSDADQKEKEILGSFSYQENIVVAHSDASFMPKRKNVWATWNFIAEQNRPFLTYFMNGVHRISKDFPIFVTLNPTREPDPEKVHGRFLYTHPIHSTNANKARKRLSELQGKGGAYFCGSYFGFGFHEDAFVSGIQAAKHIDPALPDF